MPLGLRKIPLSFSFRSFSPLQIDIFLNVCAFILKTMINLLVISNQRRYLYRYIDPKKIFVSLYMSKGETITRVNGNVSFFAGKRLLKS